MVPSTELNGWDYVLAIALDEVNATLRSQFESGCFLQQTFEQEIHSLPGEPVLQVEFGAPHLHPRSTSLLLCDLVLPITLLTITTQAGEQLCAVKYFKMAITSSLASFSMALDDVKDSEQEKQLVFNFKDENAVYQVHFPLESSLEKNLIERLLRKFLWHHQNTAVPLARIKLAADANNDLTPAYAEFSFAFGNHMPGGAALIVTASFDPKGPNRDGRLSFHENILPPGLPACQWIGHRLLMERVLKKAIEQQFHENVYKDADGNTGALDLNPQNRQLNLRKRISMFYLDKVWVHLEKMTIYTNSNAICFALQLLGTETSTGVLTTTHYKTQVNTTARITLRLIENNTSFATDLHTDEPQVHDLTERGICDYVYEYNPGALVSGLFTGEDHSTEEKAKKEFEYFFQITLHKLGTICNKTPALARLMRSERLTYRNVSIHDNSTFCLEIIDPE